jgi:uncharacterized protein (TIGR00730 family)
MMRSLCVFCGSRHGNRPEYRAAALAIAEELVDRRIRLIYGGGDVGLMGVLADHVLARGGDVVGVIPRRLMDREVAHRGLTQLHVVESMHERKALMSDLSDGFIAIPGGVGTLEELFEIVTWRQLGIHAKPCGLLNAAGYFDPLLAFLERAVEEGFLAAEHLRRMLVHDDPRQLVATILESAVAAPELETLPPQVR